ncbi:2-C-methyl-D-erythritol 4-phosphate cytidylyltransferase [Paenibacillus macquariensis]|uniref:2-C-methyl-D-erythritol 4-phosphate cytidylyltransferase n=1 Tax=Paenibacillus macquariensis TaxID=948756 RepID=A0ABY1KCP2_9BACL|nr:2-C-methyl-D-erythritol 4-phosphate cytidylyltransferase [Paenibacillus macquariensis]MEC0094013.1 2-C-methyl-D-erythritol 4-phosphate cytidylyltransferase [Paenibacillus macquariensis]OAB28703.1 2-C-methyl-D-erythritol 4-phosphate cytidylyltransferase [Paenibacillus macquariensis subsp. macquariensis]SIR61411.1 2-C-methyl-D-erythritol 4-phosphate cytidylyltransferase [Paenibacillus macquariensis]
MDNSLGIVIVSAGKGSRMGTLESKQYLLLQDKPILIHTLEVFNSMPQVKEIVLVTGQDDVGRVQEWVHEYKMDKVIQVIPGGSERQYSVYKGLLEIGTEWVMIHDGVRPFVDQADIEDCYQMALRTGAAVLAVPVKDTIKQVDGSGIIVDTPDRQSLWAIQTPQTFRVSDLLRSHEEAQRSGFVGTDDSMLVERMGIPVAVVKGSYTNIKITTPDDLEYAAFIKKRKGEG